MEFLIAEVEMAAVGVFAAFVIFVLGLSFYLGGKAKSAEGYFAAGGTIHWGVNGISFAGDYLSAASFLGICGMIATCGYDGFLYSIGYLAGWIVALFVVAEPMKRLGKYTFTDALDSKFNSKAIQLLAAISTLVVSICYLIPQMVGAGSLVVPLLGLPHWAGVSMVGAIVIFIVATAGMASTTYVQFLKGGLLIIFSTVLVICVCNRGLTTDLPAPVAGGEKYVFTTLDKVTETDGKLAVTGYKSVATQYMNKGKDNEIAFVKLESLDKAKKTSWWKKEYKNKNTVLRETQWKIGDKYQNLLSDDVKKNDLIQMGGLTKLEGSSTGPVSPVAFLAEVSKESTEMEIPKAATNLTDNGKALTIYYPTLKKGNKLMRTGGKFKTKKTKDKIDFASLMLALFFGTAALPHILIRYYTVPDQASARKSTIVAIAAIGFFYILTMYMGIGAMANGVVNPADGNMSAPLLAKSFSSILFAIISAIAFATVLGTVSGLIVASSGAVAHDMLDRFGIIKDLTSEGKVRAGKIAAVVVGVIAIILGILFEGMNVSFLVGWAFAIAAAANLPSILMLLFWKKTTAKGIAASIFVGMTTALAWIMMSPTMFVKYGYTKSDAWVPLDNPGIVAIPLSFIVLVIVSLMTQKDNAKLETATAE